MSEQKPQRGLSIDAVATDPARMRARCEALIIAMVGQKLAPQWWNGANRAFAGNTPEQMYSTDPEAVYAYLMRSAEGEW
jgi:hypothetical protein